ncbi:hypothetical protein Y032_0162g3403 [Ancylostoma ceylanicum]|uniref:Uncharacterized protein n=1 Tax=Ancylostoma ceylanicum TaxID=53326 RepID=A0A016SXH4_9BILA|nr:hypothetical protein Y032_0162g3403 [Ancylostoma ceylanicum]
MHRRTASTPQASDAKIPISSILICFAWRTINPWQIRPTVAYVGSLLQLRAQLPLFLRVTSRLPLLKFVILLIDENHDPWPSQVFNIEVLELPIRLQKIGERYLAVQSPLIIALQKYLKHSTLVDFFM